MKIIKKIFASPFLTFIELDWTTKNTNLEYYGAYLGPHSQITKNTNVTVIRIIVQRIQEKMYVLLFLLILDIGERKSVSQSVFSSLTIVSKYMRFHDTHNSDVEFISTRHVSTTRGKFYIWISFLQFESLFRRPNMQSEPEENTKISQSYYILSVVFWINFLQLNISDS